MGNVTKSIQKGIDLKPEDGVFGHCFCKERGFSDRVKFFVKVFCNGNFAKVFSL